MWTRRRLRAPCDKAIPREWGLDAIYLRHEGERAYCERLYHLQVQTAPPRLSPELLCFSEPCIPHMWLPPQTPCPPTTPTSRQAATCRTRQTRELRWTAHGHCANSRWLALLEIRDGLSVRRARSNGTPGSTGFWFHSSKWNYMHRAERRGIPCMFVAQSGGKSPLVMVPIPPVVTYRASMLLSEKKGTPEYDFWWKVMEVEWVVLIFGRWCADIQERTIMWRLPVRARRGLDKLKVENLFHRSPYNVQNVLVWLQDHDAHNWEASHMFH
jgi:hypothetical protein